MLIVLALFITVCSLRNQVSSRTFYVGVEYAYGGNETAQVQIAQIEALVDKVKNYTNLFVIGSVGFKFNSTALSEACDYIFNAKLNFIVLFTGLDMYSFDITQWMQNATVKYGEQFLGIDRYDEPGGNQLDQGASMLIDRSVVGANATYSIVANNYTYVLSYFPNYYLNFTSRVFTSDYGLFWFDYKANYSGIFAEFVGNESRQRIIALDRGAAESFGRDWGVTINWKYNQPPYLESGDELYSDLALAYSAGAKYAVVFSYPSVTSYGTLTQEHFGALEKFWTTIHTDPASLGSNSAQAAYVVPIDYGFGFRSPTDSIWGMFPVDLLSAKIFDDANKVLPVKYGARFNIIYDDPETAATLKDYSKVFYWNQTIS
jgi:hypothetical protein